jgi:transcriptional regulator with XRE-family HTH domain
LASSICRTSVTPKIVGVTEDDHNRLTLVKPPCNFGVVPKALDEIAAVGATVASNVQSLRKARGITLQALSDRLAELGRPIPIASLSKLEKRLRRVDADDLVALAIALDVSPVRLLLPGEPPEDRMVDLAPTERSNWVTAWLWAIGEQPLIEEKVRLDSRRVSEYIAENRPHERPKQLVTWAARYLLARSLGGPFFAEFRYNGKEFTKSQVTYGSGDDDGR